MGGALLLLIIILTGVNHEIIETAKNVRKEYTVNCVPEMKLISLSWLEQYKCSKYLTK